MQIELWRMCLRLFIACICGAFIGYERSLRQKEAGLRTHIILALGACLAMIVSKYGFADIAEAGAMKTSDGARIAAQVVSGVGFLGAGVIFVRGGSVKGLTTAAGIWTTSSVGLAIGAGMYAVGIVATIFMVLAQIILHRFLPASEMMVRNVISIVAKSDTDVVEYIQERLQGTNMHIQGIKFKKRDDGLINVEITVNMYKNENLEEVLSLAGMNENITELTLIN